MLSVAEAIARLCADAPPPPAAESAPLAAAAGRVLAGPVTAPVAVPPADNSAMDGYALRCDDWPGPEHGLPVTQRVTAGAPPAPLAGGTAARIFTGAEIPAGADAVVMQERCETPEGAAQAVRILDRPRPGANIRPRGQDIEAGQALLEAGRRLRAQELGLLASIGAAELTVRRRLRVAVLSNGDELVEPGHDLAPGQIYNSNRYLLRGLLEGWGFELVDLGVAPDDPERIRARLVEAAERADVILSSGGVSVGEEDHVRAVLEDLGRLKLWKIAVKPGKPLAFGEAAGKPFIGLPGNPASVLVTALVFARPFLFACQGISEPWPEPFRLPACFDHAASDRQQYLRARRGRDGVECYPNQSSGVLLSACWGDGLVVQAPGEDISAGEPVRFLPYALLR